MVLAQPPLIRMGGLECQVKDKLMFSAFPPLKKVQAEEVVGRHFLVSSPLWNQKANPPQYYCLGKHWGHDGTKYVQVEDRLEPGFPAAWLSALILGQLHMEEGVWPLLGHLLGKQCHLLLNPRGELLCLVFWLRMVVNWGKEGRVELL